MTEAFSFSREFDFVRLDGLRRATGRPPHEWDIYIAKELIDNALDADEVLWRDNLTQLPRVHIRMEYISIPERQSQQLFVQVGNRTVFPIEQISDIFATQWYTSRKAFIKGLTRGALGNALKTLLGIPYALRNRVAGDWGPELKPLSILCNGIEYLPRYVVDSTSQTIRFEWETKESKHIEGTLVSIGLDHFEQEMPRTLDQVELLAEQYHLCNPHAEFNWTVEIGGQQWTKIYAADPNWMNKYRGVAPVQWYSPTAFQDLLGALYRKHCGNKDNGRLSLEAVFRWFNGFDKEGESIHQGQSLMADIGESFEKKSLTKDDIEGPVATLLYQVLYRHSPRFDSNQLGCIGMKHLSDVLTHTLLIHGDVLYEVSTDSGDDPNVPFVIEAAVARLKDGKRQIWTAINFAPTYGDPFLRRWLHAPLQPDQYVFGLRGFLDTYGLRDDTPVFLFLHLICPSVEHDEFSKTEINHLPFKQLLGELLDRLLMALRRAQEEEELRLEMTVFEALDAILSELDENERFVFDQLLEKLCIRLDKDPALSAWLETPNALGSLQTYIARYQTRNAVLTHHVARPATGTLSIPLHPDRHFSVVAEHISRDLLAKNHVNKVLYVQTRELEPVVIENGWLSRMDMAMLQNPPNQDALRDALVQCVVGSDVPILVLHNADETGKTILEQMRIWLKEWQFDINRIIDLGLDAEHEIGNAKQPTRLVEMMPGELVTWILNRLKLHGIQVKSLPSDADIRRDIRKRFEQMLLGHLWEGLSEQLEVTRLLSDLDSHLQLTNKMIAKGLDNQLKHILEKESCAESYTIVLGKVVGEFFESIMREYGVNVGELAQRHMAHLRGSRGR